MVPVIKTERLILRAMVREDFTAFAAIWAEPDVVRYICGKAVPEAESWGSFLRNAGSWVMTGHGQWGIFLKSGGPMLGQTGFFTPKRMLGPDFDTIPEVGWVLSARAHGRGYGYEATKAAHRWFDAQPLGGASGAMITPDHVVSLALAAKLGYAPIRQAEFKGETVQLLARTRGS